MKPLSKKVNSHQHVATNKPLASYRLRAPVTKKWKKQINKNKTNKQKNSSFEDSTLLQLTLHWSTYKTSPACYKLWLSQQQKITPTLRDKTNITARTQPSDCKTKHQIYIYFFSNKTLSIIHESLLLKKRLCHLYLFIYLFLLCTGKVSSS